MSFYTDMLQSMRFFIGWVLSIAHIAHGGYRFDSSGVASRLDVNPIILVPEQPHIQIHQGTATIIHYGGSSTGPELASRHWKSGYQSHVSCMTSNGDGSWTLLAEYIIPSSDEKSPSKLCEKSPTAHSEIDGVDCDNWVQPSVLKAICDSLFT